MRRPPWIARLARRVLGRAPGGGAEQGGVAAHDVTTPPETVESYWTDERLRGAVPREQRIDPSS